MNWGIIIMWALKTVVRVCIFAGCFFSFSVFTEEEILRQPAERSRLKRGRTAVPKARQTFKRMKKKNILKYVRPPVANRMYFDEGTDEAELERITQMEINQLYELFKTSKRPDIQLRLASLYVEQSRLIESRIYEKYTMDMEQYKIGMNKRMPVLNLSLVREYSQKAINLFEIYLQKQPRSRRADEVYFQLGYSYFQINKGRTGRTYYEKLIQRYPKSSYLEDAHFHLGEYYFDQAKWKMARRHYDRASRFQSKFYSFSLYKIAWCLFNEGRVNSAMKFMVRVIQEARNIHKMKGSPGLGFSAEALNDLSSFYIYSSKKASSAYSYFDALTKNEKEVFSVLKKVGFAYKDAGEQANMRYIFNLLIELEPYHSQAFDYKYQIVQAYSYAGNRKVFDKEFRLWIQNYGPGSIWVRKNKSNRELVKKSIDLMEVTLRNYAFRMHHAFLKTKRKAAQRQTLLGYQLYLRAFPKSKFDSDIRFHYGEILFDVNKLQKAAEQYNAVVQNYPKSKNHKTAAFNRVLALEKILPAEKEVQELQKRNKDVNRKINLPKVVKNFAGAVTQYAQFYPKEKNIPNMLYTAAKLHSEYRHYDKAIQYWRRIVNQYPSSKNPYFTRAVHSILDTYNLLKDFESLKKTAREFLKRPAIASLPVGREILKILRQALFKEAQDLAESGQYAESAKVYEQFFRKNQGSHLAVSALYNAALNYHKVKNFPKSNQLYQTLVRSAQLNKYPKIQKQVMQDIADIYQKSGQYLKAANAFKAYAQKYPKNVSAYWYNSAIIFDGLNFYQEAVNAYMKYYHQSKGVERNQVYFLIARMSDRRGQKTRALGNYTRYLQAPDNNKLSQVLSSFRLAELSEDLGRFSEAVKWYKTTLRLYQKMRTGVSFAAQSQFWLTEQTYKKFIRIRIPANPNLQAQAVQRKLKLLEQLKNEIKNVIRFNYGPQVVSSLTLMGLANHHLGEAILKSAVPKGLGREGRKQYKEGLAQTAKPFKDSAQEYFNQAIEKSKSVRGHIPLLGEAQKLKQKLGESPLSFSERFYSLYLSGAK